jgi:hypothetical protein
VLRVGITDRTDLPVERERSLEGGAGSVRPSQLFQQLAAFNLKPSRKPGVGSKGLSHGFEMSGQRFKLSTCLGGA